MLEYITVSAHLDFRNGGIFTCILLSSPWSGLIWIEGISWGGATLGPTNCVGRNIKRQSVYYSSAQHLHPLCSCSSVLQDYVLWYVMLCDRINPWYMAVPAVWPGWGIFLFAWPWNPYLSDCDYVLEFWRIFPSFWDINNYTAGPGLGGNVI